MMLYQKRQKRPFEEFGVTKQIRGLIVLYREIILSGFLKKSATRWKLLI